MKTVYLCGPIDGVSPEWAKGWRDLTRSILEPEFTVIDPTEGKDLHAPGVSDRLYTPEFIVDTDIARIDRSDILLVDWRIVPTVELPIVDGCPINTQPLKVGTSMEIREAYGQGKRIVAFGDLRRGYWIRYHVKEWYATAEEAAEQVRAQALGLEIKGDV